MKAIIQSHYPERRENLNIMVESLLANGLEPKDIILLIDYGGYEFDGTLQVIKSNYSMPINWWHGVASLLECDYVALLCDDLSLKRDSIKELVKLADKNRKIDVLGYEGGLFTNSQKPYSGSGSSHTSTKFEPADYIIRFYFGRPKAFVKALSLYHQLLRTKPIHDDLLLSLANNCALAPTTETSGWIELSEHGVAYSDNPYHYLERDDLVRKVKGS